MRREKEKEKTSPYELVWSGTSNDKPLPSPTTPRRSELRATKAKLITRTMCFRVQFRCRQRPPVIVSVVPAAVFPLSVRTIVRVRVLVSCTRVVRFQDRNFLGKGWSAEWVASSRAFL